MINKIEVLLLLVLISPPCFSWSLFGPKDYNECILENMKGVTSDTAATLVNKSCREKFPKKVVAEKYEWIKIFTNDNHTLYKDSSTITRHGDVVTPVVMVDYDQLQVGAYNFQYYSVIYKAEIDCIKAKIRNLMSELKPGHMGEGDKVQTSTEISEFQVISKESAVYMSLCNS